MMKLDSEIKDELAALLKKNLPLPPSFRGHSRSAVARLVGLVPDGGKDEGLEGIERPSSSGAEEAIVRLFDRPSLFVENDRIAEPESAVWRQRISVIRPNVEPRLQSVGRVELVNHDDLDWVGTAWMLTDTIAITNRHVAEVFAVKAGAEITFRSGFFNGKKIAPSIDFAEEHIPRAGRVLHVERVLYLADSGEDVPDIALLAVRPGPNLPPPILLGADLAEDEWIGVVGYPARDSRNGADAQARIFGDVFDVKRFAPGKVMRPDGNRPHTISHDASTLGGNSGSVVLSLADGSAVGLHFAGRFRQANFAVRASTIRDVARRAGVALVDRVPEIGGGEEESIAEARRRGKSDPVHEPEHFEGRKGYDKKFLKVEVDWPDMSSWEDDLAVLSTPARDGIAHRLDYTHFSIFMHARRRTPLITAVNIDGRKAKKIVRGDDEWFIDGRLDREYQMGNADAYTNNPLDRGHMVRREDPNWGDDAEQANFDTFHYTNAVPQHQDLNQKTWLELEDFVLSTSNDSELKATVFTGPVLRRNDVRYREVRVPSQFFKVVVVWDDEVKQLEATAYLQSQTDFLDDLERVFDGGSVYQVPLTQVEKLTKLDFGKLRSFDPMSTSEEESLVGRRRIREAADILHRSKKKA